MKLHKWGKSKYFVILVKEGVRKNIGYFMTTEEANMADITTHKKHHNKFT